MTSRSAQRSFTSIGFAVLLFGAYAASCLDDLSRQGLYHDVALFGVSALETRNGGGAPLRLPVGGLSLPLMVNQYNGAMEVYLAALPAIWLGGHEAYPLNLASVLWGMVMLLAGAVLCARYYRSVWAAAAFMALLGLSPSFIAGSRIGIYAGTVHGALFALALLFLSFWTATKGKQGSALLIAGFFFLGLGWGSRSLIAWYVAGLGAALLAAPALRKRLSSQSPPVRWACAGALAAGVLPVLAANAGGDWFTLRFLTRFGLRSRSGVSNVHYFQNLWERLGELGDMWNAAAWTNPGRNIWALLLLPAAAGLILWLRRSRGAKGEGGTGFTPLIILAVTLLLSPVTPTFLDVHHLFALFTPAALVMLAPLFAPLPKAWAKPVRVAFGAVFGLCLLQNAVLLGRSSPHDTLHGGHEVRWNVLSDVLDWLKDRNVTALGLGDTGILDPIRYLSGLSLQADEYFSAPYLSAAEVSQREERLRRALRTPGTSYFLFRDEAAARLPFLPEFKRLAAEERARARPEASFETPHGVPLYVIYRVDKA